ncbi:AAA family ATPase [Leucobacter chromiiresistens]|uniref:MoxR-like ATPase n=1 Tax=Leucobacter chromiiresistens TaxID=1079994 RepID=A0A1H0ZB68_9MICO|nr:MoxR family ATPase [Leucobacter chromiiresistens]SDQ24683.1 MoxR-like ATPase [Leucobacter chromiiresistens]
MSTTELSHDPVPTARPRSVLPSELAQRIGDALARVIQGQREVIETVITTVFAGGHLLLEDVPGVGKTTLAAALARSISADARRIQFTSDMLPTDVTGLSVYDQESRRFQFHPGPIFANIVIGDEVNRATPKTQSALLEAMEERSVTVDGSTHRLPELFVVVATQNPQDMEGTFALPEAQRDRFMTRISLGYPDAASELRMLLATSDRDPRDAAPAVASVEEVRAAQRAAAAVHLSAEVGGYIVDLVGATRSHPGVALGASPRASVHVSRMSRARAAVHGRDFVSPDDVASLAATVLSHRLVPQGRFARADESARAATEIVEEIVARTPLR